MTPHRLRSLLYVGLPVAIGAILVSLAAVNIVLVKTWHGELEDGVLWTKSGANILATEVAPHAAGAAVGLQRGDVLLQIDGREITTVAQVAEASHGAAAGRPLTYLIQRQGAEQPLAVVLQPMPLVGSGLYYSLALVGILSIVVGGSVRLRRPNDPATLHFFWLTVAFFGVLAFTPSGRYNTTDHFFEWADTVARLVLPPLFLHFSLVFPERPNPWVRTAAGRATLPVLYAPAALLGFGRAALAAGWIRIAEPLRVMTALEVISVVYLAACLLAGLALMTQALGRLRSVTARRQLRWIVWGSSVGALPFILLYAVPLLVGAALPGMEYTAVLLGCIPLAFASAIVRYRLMDIEVIIKRGLVVSAVALVLGAIYAATLWLLDRLPGVYEGRFWALLATLVVALVAPSLWKAIQAGLDRLYYRDRYDYRRALVSFTRDLNSDLDLQRLTRRLVDRLVETFGVDRIALFLPDPAGEPGRLVAVTASGFAGNRVPAIEPGSVLGARIADGQTVVVDDPVPVRRLAGGEGAAWREAGLFNFVPCVSNELTIGLIAVGRRPLGEPLSSEDMSLLVAVAGQAATAIENARLYSQLQAKADEVQRLHQFSDSVVESLSDGLVVVDLEDRVLRWNRRAEAIVGVDRGRAVGRRLGALFNRQFVDALVSARRDAAGAASLIRLPLVSTQGERRERLVNVAVAPLKTAEDAQSGWIIVIEDVTERANLEEQLRLSEKMAAIGLLAAGVAHEVNTPLTGISSFTQMLLERTEQADPRKELLEKIERQTFRAAKIVNSLLSLARPSGGETQALDVNVTIGEVLSLLEHQFKLARIQVRRELANREVVVQGVEYKLQQVFLNLFLNARDAMPKGGWLSVTSRADNGHAVIEVADTGVGIPAEHLARIYDPFFTTKTEGRGTGLGLSVTYGIVQEHGGTLVCESDIDQGTRFRLMLPLVDPAAVEAAQ